MFKKNLLKGTVAAITVSVAGIVVFLGCQENKLSQNNPVTASPEITVAVTGIDVETFTECQAQVEKLQSSDASFSLKAELVSDKLTLSGDSSSFNKFLSIPQPLAKTANNTYCLTCGPCYPPVQHQGRYYNRFFALLDLAKRFGGGTVSAGACNCSAIPCI